MSALRKALAALFLVFATVAFALTPGERIVLFSGIKPVWQCNLLAGTLCPGLTWTVPTTLRTLYDSTGKLTYGGNNLLLQSNSPANVAWSLGNTASLVNTNAVSDPVGGAKATTLHAGANGSYVAQLGGVATPASTNSVSAIYLRRRTGTGIVKLLNASATTYTDVTSSVSSTWALVGIASTTHSSGLSSFALRLETSGDEVDFYAGSLAIVTYETSPRSVDQVITTSAAYYGPRFDYDPSTLLPRGLLVEEARTNIALYSRNMTNAAWVKSSITAALDQTGLDGVANSASSITASGANGTILQTVTLASSQRFYSAYVKRITGSGAVSMTTDNGTTWTAITVTGSWTQVSIPAQTVTNPVFGFKLATNGDAIAVDCNQNEGGAFATSAIITTSASVQRTADVVTFSGVPLAAFKSATGSFVAQTQLRANDTSTYQAVLAANDGTNFPVPAYWYTSPKHANAYNGTNFLSAANTLDLTSPQRIATSWSAIGRSVVASGGTVASDGYSAFGGYNITVANLGGNNFGTSNIINGWVQSLAIYNARLPDPTLKTKSVVGAPY